jgi:hypothetical protein
VVSEFLRVCSQRPPARESLASLAARCTPGALKPIKSLLQYIYPDVKFILRWHAMKAKVIRAIAPDRMMKVDLNSDCNAFCRITAKKKKPSDKY